MPVPFDSARVAGFVLRVGPLLDLYGGSVISWGRSPTRNAAVGGKPESCHLDFCAVDAEFFDETDRDACYTSCYAQGLHGYKKGPYEDAQGTNVWGFHMQDKPGRIP